ncbi:hypothetical protein F5141DRAFT_1065820 [Pisolithus sp. B1]|nr:hypothetical protein F5141DRAFT_1065820 [Pisolithus sp. B1]
MFTVATFNFHLQQEVSAVSEGARRYMLMMSNVMLGIKEEFVSGGMARGDQSMLTMFTAILLHLCPQQLRLGTQQHFVKNRRNDIQEELNSAVREYQSTGVHAKVNKFIQEAFQKYGEDMEVLCPILVDIAKENQISKNLNWKG